MTELDANKKSSRKLIKVLLTGLVLSFIINMVMFVMVLGSLQQIYRHISYITEMCEKSSVCSKSHNSEPSKPIEKAHESFAEKKKSATSK